MEKEEKVLNLHDKLLNIQQELKAPKGQYNDFGKYSYRSCEDIFEAVKPILSKYGLTLTLSDELLQIGDRYYIKATAMLEDGNEYKVNYGYAREEENKKGMDGSQITGASSSYARKYALNGLFLIDDVKDSDTTNTGEMTEEQAKEYVINFGKHKGSKLIDLIENNDPYIDWLLKSSNNQEVLKAIELLTGRKPLTDEEWDSKLELTRKLQEIIVEKELDMDKICKYYKVKNIGQLTEEQIKEIIEKRG